MCAVLATVSALGGGEWADSRRASNDVTESKLAEVRLALTVGLEVLEKRKIIFCEI